MRGRAFPAIVPGCVHTDLERAGLRVDPDRGFDEREAAWIGRTDWRYRGVFGVSAALLEHERLDLVCECLDTIAEVLVNGVVVGRAANMHHPHRFDVRAAVREGANEIVVTFRGPLAYAEEQERSLGSRPVNGDWGPYAYIRKTACHFGWDWGPCAPTSGIERSIGLHAWSGTRIRAVRPLVTACDVDLAVVDVCVDLEHAGAPAPTTLRAMLGGARGRAVRRRGPVYRAEAAVTRPDRNVTISIEVPKPTRWWPRGCGVDEFGLYDLEIELLGDVDAIDAWSGTTGLRTVELDTAPDADGAAFTLRVNGQPVFCRGANWIPPSLFPPEVRVPNYQELVRRAARANMNMLRVWGGGQYEPRAFYEACDQHGIMVWQDFMFACATYPEEDPYPALVEAEARHQVARLSRHPSVVLWCGGNENILAYENWDGWKAGLAPGQTWGERYWLQQLPKIVRELDPTRPYWPDSPYSGGRDLDPNDPDRGDRHTWDANLDGYRALVPRFVSEFGHQGPPSLAAWRAATGEPADAPIDSEANAFRQRATGGNERQYAPIADWFAEPESFEEWHYLAQLLQARSVGIGVEWLRANRPRCMGALIWQLNDVWTGHSWSAIDVSGRPKPLYWALKAAFAPLLLTIHPIDGRPTLFVANDAPWSWPWEPVLRVRRIGFDGVVRAQHEEGLCIERGTSLRVGALTDWVGEPEAPSRELLVVDADGPRATWFFDRDRALELPAPIVTTTVHREDRSWVVEVRAETLVRDLVLAVDTIDPEATVEGGPQTLLPGETGAFVVVTDADLDAQALSGPPVLRCANQFAAPRASPPA